MCLAYLRWNSDHSSDYCDSDDFDGSDDSDDFDDFVDFDDSDSFYMDLNSYTYNITEMFFFFIESVHVFYFNFLEALMNSQMKLDRTPVDLAEVNFSVCDAYYYYSYLYFCADSFGYAVEGVAASLVAVGPMVMVAVAASDCISVH